MNNIEGTWVAALTAQNCAISQDDAAEAMHVSRRSVQLAKAVLDASPSQPTENGLVLDVDLLPDLRLAINDLAVGMGLDAKHALPKPASAPWLDEVLRVKP